MTATIPSGILTYPEAEDTIETIADNKARQFKKIGWLDEEDIKQEVRSKCFKTLHRYDSKKGNDLYVFLSKCADNRLRDIRRSVLYKHNKPCFRCPHWDKAACRDGLHDCTIFSDKMDCQKFSKHERYVQAKFSASHPSNVDEGRIYDTRFENRISRSDLVDYIEARIDNKHKYLFRLFEEANFNLKVLLPREQTVLCEIIVEALESYEEDL